MTTSQFAIFVILLTLPSIYQRSKFELNRKLFLVTRLRQKSGLQIHHAHWGAAFIFIGSILMLFVQKNTATIALIGYGWGLVLDEIIPWLKMPSVGREKELEVYARTRNPTFILIFIVILLCLGLYYI